MCHHHSLEVQQSNHATWIHTSTQKKQVTLKLARLYLTLDICSAAPVVTAFTPPGLCSSKFTLDGFYVLFDVLLVGFFHEPGCLQVMDPNKIHTGDHFATLAFMATWPVSASSPPPRSSPSSRSCKRQRTPHCG